MMRLGQSGFDSSFIVQDSAMPARQPFTRLCQTAARSRSAGRADLHVHTTSSDGLYSPAEIVELAQRSGLAAVAITDHDTLDGVPAARAAAAPDLEVIAGVEISTEYHGHELHLLGYFVRLDDAPLLAALTKLRADRAARFWEMVDRLRGCGVSIDKEEVSDYTGTGTLGRRNLADFLVKTRRAGSVREAFTRYLGDRGRVVVPKVRLPVAEALRYVRGAAGVAAWAHPSYDCTRESLAELRDLGLGAVEVEYPSNRTSRSRQLRTWAAELGLAVTAGSDCHGAGQHARAVGACSVTADELDRLRQAHEPAAPARDDSLR
jgi:predicted metal-dependent phosphoesterase TrpH